MIRCLEPVPYCIPCSQCRHRDYCEDQPTDRQAIIDYINGKGLNNDTQRT